MNLFETAFLCVFKLNSNVIFEELVWWRQNIRTNKTSRKLLINSLVFINSVMVLRCCLATASQIHNKCGAHTYTYGTNITVITKSM